MKLGPRAYDIALMMKKTRRTRRMLRHRPRIIIFVGVSGRDADRGGGRVGSGFDALVILLSVLPNDPPLKTRSFAFCDDGIMW